MKYPKIHSVYKRDENHKFIMGEYSCPEFALIDKWQCQEKIDGTNIRVSFKYNKYDDVYLIGIQGRTDEASIPAHLLNYLKTHFTPDRFDKIIPEDKIDEAADIILFGEGYGPSIQGGGNYRDTQGFILFDVVINRWWLKQEDVKDIAAKLEIPYAPIIDMMTIQEAIDYVRRKPFSQCSVRPQPMEGLILRPHPLLLFRDSSPLMLKVKVKDLI